MRKLALPISKLARRYEHGENTPALGRAYGVSQRTIRHRLHAAGVRMRPRGAPLGHTYTRRPGGPLFVGCGYLRTLDRNGKQCRVHRGCWEAHRGAIPKGYIVHHIDGDRMNNAIENLACLPHGEHTRLHRTGGA